MLRLIDPVLEPFMLQQKNLVERLVRDGKLDCPDERGECGSHPQG